MLALMRWSIDDGTSGTELLGEGRGGVNEMKATRSLVEVESFDFSFGPTLLRSFHSNATLSRLTT